MSGTRASWLQAPRGLGTVHVLPIAFEEKWEDGTHVVFRSVPFPFRSKPHPPARTYRDAKRARVSVNVLNASQKVVTDGGLRKYRYENAGEKDPIVYPEADGTYTIMDGHHRLVAAWLRGDSRVRVRVLPP